MADSYTTRNEDLRSTRAHTDSADHSEQATDFDASTPYSTALLGNPGLQGRGNTPGRVSVMQNAQATYGNRALQRTVGQSTGSAGTNSLPVQRFWPTPVGTSLSGNKLPASGEGGYGFWEDNKSNLDIPGLPFDVPLHDVSGGFGIGFGGTPMFAGGMDIGNWDAGNGNSRYGARGNIGLVPDMRGNVGNVLGQPLELEGQMLAANGELSLGGNGFSAGAGASLFAGGGTLGDFSQNSQNETSEQTTRMTVGAGVGAGGRLHWGDSDGDGYQEFGYGVDAGPISFDIKSEDPLRSLVSGGPFSQVLPASMIPANYLFGEEGNLTYDAMDMAGSAASTVAGGLESALDWASPMWMGESGGLDPVAPQPVGGGGGLEGLFPLW